MTFSFSFNDVNMADYGLVIRKRRYPFIQLNDSIQLLNRAYGLSSLRPAGTITLDVAIITPAGETTQDNLDNIKYALNHRVDAELAVDYYLDRYWMARFNSIDLTLSASNLMEGTVVFNVFDPTAYDNDETESGPHTIDEEDEEITETVGGTEQTSPVLTLVANDTLTDTTVEVENTTTGEVIEWTGDLVADRVLEIDCENKTVKINDVLSMLTVSGQFPKLLVGTNLILFRGFTGVLTIVYTERYV